MVLTDKGEKMDPILLKQYETFIGSGNWKSLEGDLASSMTWFSGLNNVIGIFES